MNYSDYASPGFAGFRYLAPGTDWHFLQLFANLAILAIFWRFFWPILILGQFVIATFFDWSIGLGEDSSGHAYMTVKDSIQGANIS